ncbi:MAG TPA: hypothetical protein VEK08_26885 [Planctomycetota bacterium]|nr:hypothetical protein [Planctomycetota bacterium]
MKFLSERQVENNRTGEIIWNLFCILALWAVFCASLCLFGCAAPRRYTQPSEQQRTPEPLAEIVSPEEVEQIERQRREEQELRASGLSLERLTGN